MTFVFKTLLGGALIACAAQAGAADTKPADPANLVKSVMSHALAEAPGKQGVVVTVDFPPGHVSVPHRHPGSVYAYVLEGEVVSQLEGKPAVTYRAGDAWYESPREKHVLSKNASATRPARLLVWMVSEAGHPLVQPL